MVSCCMIRPTTKLVPDNTKAYLRLSTLHYEMGEVDDALRYAVDFQHIFNNINGEWLLN